MVVLRGSQSLLWLNLLVQLGFVSETPTVSSMLRPLHIGSGTFHRGKILMTIQGQTKQD